MKNYNQETGTYNKDQSFELNLVAKCNMGSTETELKGKIAANCSQRFMASCILGLSKESEELKNAIIQAAVQLISETEDEEAVWDKMLNFFKN